MSTTTDLLSLRFLTDSIDTVGRPMTRAQKHFSVGSWIALVAALGLYLLASTGGYTDDQRAAQQACQMVHIWYQSHHRNGWAPANEWERRNCR